MNTRPNIFSYAQKELTQDAMVCWLLKCCHCIDEKYRKIGHDFIRFILNDNTLSSEDIELEKGEDSPHNQYYRMDVYANVRIKDKIHPIIFEDKTNTYLHSGQHIKYINTVNGWKSDKKWSSWKNSLFAGKELEWGNTIFILFKLGYLFDWQKEELKNIAENMHDNNAELKIITLEDMSKFIAAFEEKDELLADYSAFLKKKLSDMANCTEAECDRYFQRIFYPCKQFRYSHQGWGDADFAIVEDKTQEEENRIYYGLRSDWRKGAGGEYEYAIIMQQYRNEKNIGDGEEDRERLIKERYELTEDSRKWCREIFAELGREDIEIEENDRNRMPSGNTIFKRFINEKNEKEVCSFFHDFIRKFTQKLQTKYTVTNVINQ